MRNFVLPLLLAVALGVSPAAMAATYGGGYSQGGGGTAVAPAPAPAPAAHAPAVAAPIHLKTTRGTIKLIDAKACTITLTSKSVYQFGPKCDFTKLKVGEKVAIKWAPKGKIHNATSIAAR